jgi:hypothetical protein
LASQEGFYFLLVNHPVAIAFYKYIIADSQIIASSKPKNWLFQLNNVTIISTNGCAIQRPHFVNPQAGFTLSNHL